ncbi:MAG TPA: hypothetical protein VI542_33135 [Candidatus Tectomicrobia bacterium]
MTRIYLASRYSRYPELQQYAKELEALGHTVTSRWIRGDHEIRTDGQAETDAWQVVWAQEDLQDLQAAECVISFTEPPQDVPGRSRGGRHVETGVALALNKMLVIIGYRENVFHWLPQVAFFETWDAYVETLRSQG